MAEKYNKYLWREIFTIEILSLVLIIALFFFIYFLIYYIKKGNKQNAIANILAITICVGSCIAGVIHLVPYRSDIKNASYVKYEEEFTVEDCTYSLSSGSKPIVGFPGKEKGVSNSRGKIICQTVNTKAMLCIQSVLML